MILYNVIPEFSRTEETIQSAVRCPSDPTDEEGEILEPITNKLDPIPSDAHEKVIFANA